MTKVEVVLFWLVIGCYFTGLAFSVYRFAVQKSIGESVFKTIILTGAAINLAAVVLRIVNRGELIFAFKYDSNLIIALLVLGALMLLQPKINSHLFFIAGLSIITLILMGGYAASLNESPAAAGYISRWLILHAFFAMVGVACFVTAVSSSVLYLYKTKPSKKMEDLGDMPVANPGYLLDLNFRLVLAGFVCWTVMMISGFFWAKELWGNYWGWDAVETWSLVSWLAWGLYLHLQISYRKRDRLVAWFCLFSFIITVVNLWGVQMVVPESYHQIR